MPSYTIAVVGIPPKYKTQTGNSPWTDPSQAPLMRALRDAAHKVIPRPATRTSSVTLRIKVHASRSDGDLDNFLMAICDALQGDKSMPSVAQGSALWIGAVPSPDVAIGFENDDSIDEESAVRVIGKEGPMPCRYEVEVSW